jgi:hypothetical protein
MRPLLLNGQKLFWYEVNVWAGKHAPIHMKDGLDEITVRPKPSPGVGNVTVFDNKDKTNILATYAFSPDDMTSCESQIVINNALEVEGG